MNDETKSGRGESPLSRRSVERAARSLRQKPGWDPSRNSRDPAEDAFERLVRQARASRVAGETTECVQCVEIRVETGDDTALCERHLAEAMGL